MKMKELIWSEHERLASFIGSAVVEGNESYDSRTLGLRAIDAIHAAGYEIKPIGGYESHCLCTDISGGTVNPKCPRHRFQGMSLVEE